MIEVHIGGLFTGIALPVERFAAMGTEHLTLERIGRIAVGLLVLVLLSGGVSRA
jgi:hypothetical protein